MNIATVEDIHSLEDKVITTLSKIVLDALNALAGPPFYTNESLAEALGVCQRTLQTWRDEGKIRFSQIGRVIIYTREQVYTMLYEHSNDTFQDDCKRKRKNKSGNSKTTKP